MWRRAFRRYYLFSGSGSVAATTFIHCDIGRVTCDDGRHSISYDAGCDIIVDSDISMMVRINSMMATDL